MIAFMKKSIQKYGRIRKLAQSKTVPVSKVYVPLPKSLDELSRGYKSLVRELSKR